MDGCHGLKIEVEDSSRSGQNGPKKGHFQRNIWRVLMNPVLV
jgi:hypothetical protein